MLNGVYESRPTQRGHPIRQWSIRDKHLQEYQKKRQTDIKLKLKDNPYCSHHTFLKTISNQEALLKARKLPILYFNEYLDHSCHAVLFYALP